MMKKLLVGLLLWSSAASAQVGNFPPLVGQRGATQPTNCPVGMLFFDTSQAAGSNLYGCTSANTWTAMGGATGITIGTTTITGGATTQVLYNLAGVVQSTATLLINATAGQGPSIVAGTATTAVSPLAITQTWNAVGVTFPGLLMTITDTASAAASNAMQILGGASGTTNLFNVTKAGIATAPIVDANSAGNTGSYRIGGSAVMSVAGSSPLVINGAGFSAVTAGGTTWNFSNTNVGNTGSYQTTARIVIGATAPTLASGGCTSPTAVTGVSTAAFSVGVGTSCSGSQPLVFTLPAATTGWQCNARNQTNPAGNSPAQSSTVSTTSVTITNYSRTLGTAAAWNDSDVVVVSCLGY